MRNVRIGFSRSNGLIGRLIRLFTRGPVNHTFVLVEVDGREMVISADWNGFVMQSLEKFRAGSKVIGLFGSAELGFDLDHGSTFLLDELDAGYDYWAITGMVWVCLARACGRKNVRNPLGSKTRVFCSEVATEMLQDEKFPGAEALDPHATDPWTLMQFLTSVKR